MRRKEFQMGFHRQLRRLRVEVVDGSRRVATQTQTKGLILDFLETVDGRARQIRIINWRSVVEDRPDERFESS